MPTAFCDLGDCLVEALLPAFDFGSVANVFMDVKRVA
jgi:hypothetical protein